MAGGLEGWRTAEGARFADMEGDGEERDGATPLVWMPGGMGRLTLVATGAAGAAATVGAIEADELPARGSVVRVGDARSVLFLQAQIACAARREATMGSRGVCGVSFSFFTLF